MTKERAIRVFWRIVNPLVMLAAGHAPWWLVLETTGRRSGLPRRIPIARGPVDDRTHTILAAHGRRALWVRNIEANPNVRIRHRGRWREGTATLGPVDPAVLERFNFYARHANDLAAIDPLLVRIDLGRTMTR